MSVIRTNLLTELQSRINAVSATTPIEDIIALRRAARNMGLNEMPLNTELSTRIAGLNASSTIDAIFESAMALPNNGELGAINELRAFCSDQDTAVDQFGGLWLRAGIISYDIDQYPQAARIPIIEDIPSTAPVPVPQPALASMTGKRIASSGSVVVAINSAGNGLTRWVNNMSTTGSAVSMTGELAGVNWSAICYDERLQQFVMVGHSTSKVVRSVDGLTWVNVALPAGLPAWSNAINAVVHGGRTAVHLFIQNKHWTSTNLTTWVSMTDTPTPNGNQENMPLRELKGVVETSSGQMMLWGDFYSNTRTKRLAYLAISDAGGAMTATITGYAQLFSSDSSEYRSSCAAAAGATDFELWLENWPGFTIKRTSASQFVAVQLYSMPLAFVPVHALSFQGLTIRVSPSALTAQNQLRGVQLPYGVVGHNLQGYYIKAISATVLVRLGGTVYAAGNSSDIFAFDVRQFVGLPAQVALSVAGPLIHAFASYFVRIR